MLTPFRASFILLYYGIFFKIDTLSSVYNLNHPSIRKQYEFVGEIQKGSRICESLCLPGIPRAVSEI